MDSEDDCSMHFSSLDMKYDSFFMVFQKKNLFEFQFSVFEIVDALMGEIRLLSAVADVAYTPI